MSPQRVQMSRQRPWRAEHPDAVICDRRTIYGNPFRVVKERREWVVLDSREELLRFGWRLSAVGFAIDMFEKYQLPTLDLGPLVGRDLACWCPLVDAYGMPVPCHVDVLLELSNSPKEA